MFNLSIIIPHYNSVNSLIALLNSIPEQEDIQVIVVDDKSNKCAEEYNALKNKYRHVKFLHNNSDTKGAGVCRNIGLQNAQGKWLLFADADDFFVDGFYDRVTVFFDTQNDIVFFSPTSKDNLTGEESDRHLQYKERIQNYIENAGEESVLYLRYTFYVPWSKMFRHAFIKDNNIFFDETIASNDVMFSTKSGHYMQTFQVSDETIYCVTKGIGTLTKTISENVFDARVAVYVDYGKFLQKNAPEWAKKTLGGSRFILIAITYKLGIKKAVSVYRLFSKNKIPIFSKQDFNLRKTFKKFLTHIMELKKDKVYFR